MNGIEHTTDGCQCEGKSCNGCGRVWCTGMFYRLKTGKTGLQSKCKECVSEIRKAHYQRPEVREQKSARSKALYSQPEIRERRLAYQNGYNNRPENKERILIQKKDYYYDPENRERILAQKKDYHARPEVQESQREYYKVYRTIPEKRAKSRSQRKGYYHTKRAQILAQKKIYRARPEVRTRQRAYQLVYCSNPENFEKLRKHSTRRRARERAVPGTYTTQQILDQLKRQKCRCYYAACGRARFKQNKGRYIYHIEHTYPLSRVAGTGIPANSIEYLVLACPSCNLSKNNKYPWEWAEGGRLL